MKVVISSGHGKYVRGASGYIDEVDEARRVVEGAAAYLRSAGHGVTTYHDDVSHSQDENLARICDFHNAQGPHDLDVSVHFNAYQTTSKPMGTEVFYVSSAGQTYARRIVDKICDDVGFINRGPKTGNLYFLQHTAAVAVLVEVCFVDSRADCDLYGQWFDDTCLALAEGICGQAIGGVPIEPGGPPAAGATTVAIDIDAVAPVRVTINGQTVIV